MNKLTLAAAVAMVLSASYAATAPAAKNAPVAPDMTRSSDHMGASATAPDRRATTIFACINTAQDTQRIDYQLQFEVVDQFISAPNTF